MAATSYAQFRGVMTVQLDQNSQAAFSRFQTQAQAAGRAGQQAFDGMRRSVSGLEGSLRAAGAGIGAFSGYGGRLASQFNAAANAIAITGSRVGGLIAALAGGATLLGATTDIQNYTARLRAATSGQAEFNSVYATLLNVSRNTRSDLGETINFYTRLQIATKELGLGQQQLGGIITTVQQSIRLSGAGAQEANAALIQFVQGISSANGLSGDEFKSLGENATVVLRAIAQGIKQANIIDGFDGTISSLRKLGAEGKLTAAVVVPALQRVSGQIQSDFDKLPPTIEQANLALRNSFLNLIVEGENATGILAVTANTIQFVANNLGLVGTAGIAVASIFVGRVLPAIAVARWAAFSIAAEAAALSLFRFAGGASAAAVAGATLRAAATGLVGILGGPVGGALTAASLGVLFLTTRKNAAEKAAKDMGIAESDLAGRVEALTGTILSQNNALDRNVELLSARARRQFETKVAESKDDLQSERVRLANVVQGSIFPNVPASARKEVSDFSKAIRDGLDVREIDNRLDVLERRFPNVFRTFGSAVDKASDQLKIASARFKSNELEFVGGLDAAFAQDFPLKPLARPDAAQRQTAAEVVAGANRLAAEAGTIKAAQAAFAEAKLQLDKSFGLRRPGDLASFTAERQKEYQRELATIIQSRDAQVKAIKEAETAKRLAERQGRSERRAELRQEERNRQIEIQAINSIQRSLPEANEALREQIELANQQALVVTKIKQEDFARLAILDLQLAGQEATAQALARVVQEKQAGRAVDISALDYIARQVEAESQRNVLLQRRQSLLSIESRALGQIQSAFTNLFAGDAKSFLPNIANALRQQFAQSLSLKIFGDVENEAQLENTGALKVNTNMLEQLVAAMQSLENRLTTPPESAPNLGLGAGIAPAANDNRPNSPSALLAKSAGALSDVSRLFKDKRVRDEINSDRFGAFGARAGGTFGLRIGSALETVFGGGSKDEAGNILPGRFASTLGRIGAGVGAGFQGFAAGRGALSIIGDLGIGAVNSKQGKTGSAIGAIAGGGIAAAIGGSTVASTLGVTALGAKLGIAGGPLGIAVGAVIGTIIGGLFGAALKKNPFGDARITAGQPSSIFNSRGADSPQQALSIADSVNESINRLASALGAGVRTGASLGSIGFSGQQFYFNGNGGDFKGAGAQRFSSAEEAVAAALRNAVQAGAFEGLRDGTKRLLLAGADLQAQAQKASEFEGVFKDLRRTLDPAGAAVEELNIRFKRLQGIFVEAGASVDEFGKLQQLYDLQRAQALAQANDELKNFLTQLTTSPGSGLSVRDRQEAATAAFTQFQADITAGRGVDQAKFTEAAQTLLDVNRELFGSQTEYFDSLGLVTELTRKAITNAEQQVSLPEALRLANQPVTDGLTAVQRSIENGFADLSGNIARVMGGGVANDWSGSYGGNSYPNLADNRF